jgi:hypothetical protein
MNLLLMNMITLLRAFRHIAKCNESDVDGSIWQDVSKEKVIRSLKTHLSTH